MIKSIIKETCIMLLLCLAIILIFGIIFYEYIPLNKVVPEKVSYVVSEDVKTELESNVVLQETQQNIRYSVSAQELRQYEQSGDYVKGNPNPFQAYNFSGNTTIIDGNNTTSQIGNTMKYYPNNTSTK